MSAQSWGWLCFSGPFHWSALRELRPTLRAALSAWLALLLVAGVIAITGLGIRPDRVGWGSPTVALLEWQVWLAWLVGTLVLYLLSTRKTPRWTDLLFAAAIWCLAAGLWLGQPIRPSFFATAGRAPNFEIYPFSDGAY